MQLWRIPVVRLKLSIDFFQLPEYVFQPDICVTVYFHNLYSAKKAEGRKACLPVKEVHNGFIDQEQVNRTILKKHKSVQTCLQKLQPCQYHAAQ